MARRRWFLFRRKDRRGPFTAAQLRKLIADGRVKPTDLVQRGAMKAVPAADAGDTLAPDPTEPVAGGTPPLRESPPPEPDGAEGALAFETNSRPRARQARSLTPKMVIVTAGALVVAAVVILVVVPSLSGGKRQPSGTKTDDRDIALVGKEKFKPPDEDKRPVVQPPRPTTKVEPKAPAIPDPPDGNGGARPVGLVRVLNHSGAEVPSVAFSPDGSQVLTGDASGRLRLWDVRTGEDIRKWEAHADRIVYVAFSPDGRLMASCGGDQCVRVWDVKSGNEKHHLTGFSAKVQAAKFTSDSNFLLTGSTDERTCLRYWDLRTGKEVPRFNSPKSHTTLIIDVSRDDRHVVSGGPNPLRLWDVRTGQVVKSIEQKTCNWGVVLLADGKRVLASGAGDDNVFHLWDFESGRAIRPFAGHTAGLQALAVTPDDRFAVSGGWDKTVRVWDMNIGKQLAVFEGHEKGVRRVAVSRDGRFAASSSYDGTARIWRMPEP